LGLENPLSLLTHDVAIDLGTANTLVAVPGRGVVLDEPSVVAVRQRGAAREVLAVGAAAKQMLGRTPESIVAVRPLGKGVIVDYEVAEAMLRYFIARALGKRTLVKPRALVCVPLGLSEEKSRAVQECTRAAGAREVLLTRGPAAAALGAELPIERATGTMICDIGAGTAEMAVLSMGGVVASSSLPCAGDQMDRDIIEYLRAEHDILIGERTAEAIKIELGAAGNAVRDRRFAIKGRDLSAGIPRQLTLEAAEMTQALASTTEAIVEGVRSALSHTPPELAADILDAGIVLSGGAAMLHGLDILLRDTSGLPVIMAPQPLRCAALGAEALLEDGDLLKRMTV